MFIREEFLACWETWYLDIGENRGKTGCLRLCPYIPPKDNIFLALIELWCFFFLDSRHLCIICICMFIIINYMYNQLYVLYFYVLSIIFFICLSIINHMHFIFMCYQLYVFHVYILSIICIICIWIINNCRCFINTTITTITIMIIIYINEDHHKSKTGSFNLIILISFN